MKLNLHIDKTISITIKDKQYPIAISGNGIPCIAIGTGTIVQRTTSAQLKKYLKVFSSELYFDNRYALDNPATLTMDKMLEDIVELGKKLELSEYIIFGHSAFGIVALEFAKKYPEFVIGIIMTGTPPNSNLEVANRNDAYFNANAESYRKMLDSERIIEYSKKDISKLSYADRFLIKYTYRDAPRYWHIPDFDCTALWDNILIDKIFDHLFSNIFPNTNVMKNLEKINCPIFLAAGNSDYNCCPFLWKEIKNLPPNMLIREFQKSGHYPQYEEQKLFDQEITEWLKLNI